MQKSMATGEMTVTPIINAYADGAYPENAHDCAPSAHGCASADAAGPFLNLIVFMLVVLVMNVFMRMRRRLVPMSMLMPFADMQPDAQRHQPARHQQ